ncbi:MULTISPECIES: serine/threonine-protein kinase [unclassified Streptomyces]|uniref:serine/threonine-protein kinase n=1 Tax=unclassified Streptomyces TaxID=2593676 RepID=UPI0003AB2412|nr:MULTISPECIES: serine/threonine-protein kinase [unclassified Streptomyces]MYT28268.1 protein kinase [Streptomyces sp. SID8354]
MSEVSGALIGGRYRLLELIGRGGMGRVWRGRDETLGREVAVKQVTLPQGVSDEDRDVLLRRVMREARAAARLNHPGIITVHDVVEHEGAPVIVMEYATGMSLAAAVEHDGHLRIRRVAAIGALMLKALGQAHAAGIVHRDLKPDNVLLMDDRVIITDFGIAHMSDATMALTHSGTLIGTPAYMAPEQLEGRPPTPATDLWSLGATLYTAVEGQPPFAAETFTALCIAIVTQELRTPERAGPLAPVLTALLAKDPSQRATAEQALAALDAVARGAEATRVSLPQTPVPTAVVPPGQGPVPPGFGAPPVPFAPPQPLVAPSPGAVAGAPAPVRGPQLSTALLVRAVGCFALVWVGALVLWDHEIRPFWHGIPRELLITGVAAVAALVNTAIRPKRPAAPVWLLFVAANFVLLFGVNVIFPVWAWMGIIVNALLLGSCCWGLWWLMQGRLRVQGRRNR